MKLSSVENKRYDRHIKLNEVGLQGQLKLKNAKVLVVGAGGLGCPVLQYLCAAGVGAIGVVDGDVVDESNLQRQILFAEENVGVPKVEAAITRLKKMNSHVRFTGHNEFLSVDNAMTILSDYDIVVDGTDNFATRYLVGDASVILKKPLVFGSIFKFEGQVSVFNFDGGPSYRCLFPSPPEEGEVPNCSDIGVIGVLPGVVGTKMANEVLKLILEIGEPLSGKLEVVNLLSNQNVYLSISRNDDNLKREELESNYDFSCKSKNTDMKSIRATELNELIKSKNPLNMIDVREIHEHQICKIEGSQLISLGTIDVRKDEISKEIPTVMICHHGMRSARAIQYLEQFGFTNLINLEGGIHSWATEVDSSMAIY